MLGTGNSTNGRILGYLWSLVSGPNVPVITNPSSRSTEVNKLIAGSYIFQFAVIDSVGLTGVDTVSVLVKPAVQQTVSLQPSNNLNEGHVDSYNLIGGAGDTELEIGSWTINGTPTNWRSFLKFDQSQIPATATIVSATLYLYSMPDPKVVTGGQAQLGTANGFFVERITAPWSASNLKWNSMPGITSTNRVAISQSTTASEDVSINVTSIVQDMQTNGNYGFAFRLQNESFYNMRQFASSFHSSALLHPKLVITFKE
ncbi:hypothetical protein SAE01_37160 [Segetibacter aerophilus]|uniref:Carbohydrate-binding module family 96 domain-containing protein n=2 Tax=Segetibacter aerophilus TaxID=670293 RepID=A0A512BGY6_9BACT|nr:hypothetical protein SAE01_37160 [Segetibacter aerophilus]